MVMDLNNMKSCLVVQVTPSFILVCPCDTKMYKQRFWMCHFNSPSMKRTILWSTGSAIAALKRYATMKKADFTFDPKNSTTVRYTNSGGKKAYKGSSKLKASQSFGSSLSFE